MEDASTHCGRKRKEEEREREEREGEEKEEEERGRGEGGRGEGGREGEESREEKANWSTCAVENKLHSYQWQSVLWA